MIILKWSLNKYYVDWSYLAQDGGVFWTILWTGGFNKNREVSWTTEILLASKNDFPPWRLGIFYESSKLLIYIGCSERRLIGHSFYRQSFLRKSWATCREKYHRAAPRTKKSNKPAQWTPCTILFKHIVEVNMYNTVFQQHRFLFRRFILFLEQLLILSLTWLTLIFVMCFLVVLCFLGGKNRIIYTEWPKSQLTG
jgi:hypothetical protein